MLKGNLQPGRAEDEFLLDLLAARTRGVDVKKLARAHGYAPDGLRAKLNQIKRTDLEQSGEPRGAVLAGYW